MDEIFKLVSIAVGRILLGGIGYVVRKIYHYIIANKKKVDIDDDKNKIVAFIVILGFFIVLYFKRYVFL